MSKFYAQFITKNELKIALSFGMKHNTAHSETKLRNSKQFEIN